MTIEGQPSTRRSKWWVGLLVTTTIAGGLGLGAALSFLAENKPFEQRPTSRLIRDLRKTDSPLDRLRQKLWPVLPVVITDPLSHFTPMSADVVRQLAAVELRRRAPAGQEAVPALVRALRDPHNGVRGMALQALAGFGPAAAAAVPEVLPMLDLTGNSVLRSEAARTLAAIAPDEPRVRTRLISVVRESPPRADGVSGNLRKANASQEALRSAVFRIMDKLARPDNEIIPLLLAELAQAEPETAVEIIGTLQRIGPITPEIIPTLGRKLKDVQHGHPVADGRIPNPRWAQQRDDVVAAVLRALQRLARVDNDVVPLLIAALPEADPSIAARIVQTLGFIGPLTPQVIPTVLTSLHVDNPRLQLSAISALGAMGAKAASAVSAMVQLLETQRAAMTNEPSGSRVDDMLEGGPELVARLGPPPIRVKRWEEAIALQLMQSLARIGPAARDAIPTMATLMAELKSELRYEAALALWRIERTNAAARAMLIEGLNIPNPGVPRRLVRHFRDMGVGELPILEAALEHLDDEVRLAAFNTVTVLASEAEPALLALERIADDSANPLHDLASRALESIQSKAAKNLSAPNIFNPALREAAR